MNTASTNTANTTPEPTATEIETKTMMATTTTIELVPVSEPVPAEAETEAAESSHSATSSSATTATPISAVPTTTIERTATSTTPAVENGVQVQYPQQPQQHQQARTTIGWAEGNQSPSNTNGQSTAITKSSSSSSSTSQSQAGSGQHQAQLGQGQQGPMTTSTTAVPVSSASASASAFLANGNNNTGYSNTQGTRTRYESKCHLEESVAPPTLLAHLRLLRLVQSLVIVDDEDLDFLFLIRSEERYLMFLDLLQQHQPLPHAVPLPPLDVALMWTVHMLAPFRYHEDLLRSYSPHLLNYAFPLERYVAAVDIEDPTTTHEAFQPSKQMWNELYPEEPFDLDKEDTSRMFDIQCLWCGGTNVMDSSTYIKFRIDGMSIDCAGCGSQCSLETLSSKRLWDGIEAYRTDPSILLAGSLLSPWTGTPDPIAAQREHHHLFFHPRIQFGLDQSSASLNCTWPKVIQTFQDLGPDQYYGIRPTTLARIMSSYMGLVEDRLSMDLVAGALRQRDFQKAMMVTGGLAWCQHQVLQRSLERYQKFMLLARAESKQTDASHSVSGPGLGAGQPVQATSTMTKQDFVRTADLWQELYQERYSSQQTWRGRFVVTPQKMCAGVVFPPYGAYLVWKSWRSKRKAKKLNRDSSGGGQQSIKKNKDKGSKIKESKKDKKALKSKTSEDATVVEEAVEGSDHMSSKYPNGNGAMEKDPELQMEELAIAPEEGYQDDVPTAQGYDIKGKGKVGNEYHQEINGDSHINGAGVGDHQQAATNDATNRNLTPALGLDGRLSNWNGDTTGPDGQASCVAGACIMSPWNELQDVMPYVDLPPHQQQRELRRERT
ncbi:hypothetical protein BGX24_009795 [Mortierella sp. AD032]|nr:hypothetical protein BGX24_009795 [Mortierella sp. AD032]